MLQKRFSHGLQFQAAYTFSKSIDDGSTFEETLDPVQLPRQPRSLAVQFEAALRSQLRLGTARSQISGLRRQSAQRLGGFWYYAVPERIPHPSEYRRRHRIDQQLVLPGHRGAKFERPLANSESQDKLAASTSITTSSPIRRSAVSTTARSAHLCCGPGLIDWDFSVHKKIPLSESQVLPVPRRDFQRIQPHQFFEPRRRLFGRSRRHSVRSHRPAIPGCCSLL